MAYLASWRTPKRSSVAVQLPDSIVKAVAAGGWPIAILLLVITQLGPKIDHGIAIADHVDSTLQRIEASCALIPR